MANFIQPQILPFDRSKPVHVRLPDQIDDAPEIEKQQLSDLQRLLEEHRIAIEQELGSCFKFHGTSTQQWILGPSKYNSKLSRDTPPDSPEIFLDREAGVLICDGPTCSDVIETLSYLRSLGTFSGGRMRIETCRNIDSAIDRVKNEITTTYPSFELRNINWQTMCEHHIPLVKAAENPVHAMQKWVAELNDGHTWIRSSKPYAELNYQLHATRHTATFLKVPQDTAGWSAGLRPGYKLHVENLQSWWERTASSQHAKPLITGRRILSTITDEPRHMIAESPTGNLINWEEKPVIPTWEPTISWHKASPTCGYIKIRAWLLGCNFDEKIDAAFAEFRDLPTLIVDLRGNPGGNILLAQSFRNRFLKKEGIVGWIQNTLPNGDLSSLRPISGTPSDPSKRWHGAVRFLTDGATYSASEDALLGLQGLPHVKVVGERSGGGSGRARKIRLLDGWNLTISTSLTYDNNKRCIENSGIPVDIPVVSDWLSNRDFVLDRALAD